ncbi:hypothetical protein CLOM_g22572 [Closterium sp. NIES-68]|nr:hypothetical protein CLOM_g22572 [Closterium sp. NIES-68]
MAGHLALRIGKISTVHRIPVVAACLSEKVVATSRSFLSSAHSLGDSPASPPSPASAGASAAAAAAAGVRAGPAVNAPVGGDRPRTIGGIGAPVRGGGARAVVRVVRADGMGVEAQLRLEEKLLRSDPTGSNWFVFNADVAAPTIVMGISGKPHELLHTEAVLEARVPVVRRFSGGGTVVLDGGSVLTSLICRRGVVPNLPEYPRPIMEWTEGLLRPAMANVPGFALRDNDYVVGDLKVGGNAQSITGSGWLHHTSFLWDYCPARMRLLQQPSRAPEYRQGRSHEQFITKLREFYSSKDDFLRSVMVALALRFDLRATALHQVEALPFQPWKSSVAVLSSDELTMLTKA